MHNLDQLLKNLKSPSPVKDVSEQLDSAINQLQAALTQMTKVESDLQAKEHTPEIQARLDEIKGAERLILYRLGNLAVAEQEMFTSQTNKKVTQIRLALETYEQITQNAKNSVQS